MCSSCKVVWETLGPGWEVFSIETEGERDRKISEKHSHFISLLSRLKKIFNNVLFTPSSERMRKRRSRRRKMQRGMAEKVKWREIDEEIQLKETYRDREQDNICFLITNHPIIITMRK